MLGAGFCAGEQQGPGLGAGWAAPAVGLSPGPAASLPEQGGRVPPGRISMPALFP